MAIKSLYLKQGREKSVRNRHPWVFSGAIDVRGGQPRTGDQVRVLSKDGKFLARGFYSATHPIACRLFSWQDAEISAATLDSQIEAAVRRREHLLDEATTACRLVNGEGDGLPGVVLDKYADVLVLRLSHAGIDRFKKDIVACLDRLLSPAAIFEKSDSSSRTSTKLAAKRGVLKGELPKRLLIAENGMQFQVDVTGGQKTGFYLDQRVNRQWIKSLAGGKRVLDCFAYTGGFTVAAAQGGASVVTSVESSEPAMALLAENLKGNGLTSDAGRQRSEDVFRFLRETDESWDLAVLDPPPFARHRKDVAHASKAYKDLNLQALKRLAPGGRLLTCSCSQHISPDLFQKILFGAAADSGRDVRIVGESSHPEDHPVSIFHPEGRYLHAFLLEAA